MKIAVTGARGFIGSHTVKELASHGHEVLGLGRADPSSTRLVPVSMGGTNDAVTSAGVSLTDLFHDVGAVVHLAARSVDSLQTPLHAYLESNVELTEQLLLASVEAGVERFVLASTRLVYPASASGPISESCAEPPDTFYGLSKKTAETLVQIHAAQSDLSGVSLRLGQVYGPGDRGRGALPAFIERALADEPLVVAGRGAAVRDFVHVRDVARALRMAVSTETSVPALNIGTGGRTIRAYAEAVAAALGEERVAITTQPLEIEDMSHYGLACLLADRELGWQPRVPLDEGIRERLHASEH